MNEELELAIRALADAWSRGPLSETDPLGTLAFAVVQAYMELTSYVPTAMRPT